MAYKLVDHFLGISHFMDRYLKLKNGMEAVVATGSRVCKNMKKANKLRITTFFTKSLFFPFAMHSTFENLDIFQLGTPVLFQSTLVYILSCFTCLWFPWPHFWQKVLNLDTPVLLFQEFSKKVNVINGKGLLYGDIPGGAEPTDTFQIWILRRRDSLLWLAGRGTVEERTPFRMVSRNGSLERATMFGTVIISRFGDIAWPARSSELTVPDFFLWGVPERPCVLEVYHDYSRTQTTHCWQSCGYWWGPTEARVRWLPDTLATMHWCKRRPSAWCNFQKISL